MTSACLPLTLIPSLTHRKRRPWCLQRQPVEGILRLRLDILPLLFRRCIAHHFLLACMIPVHLLRIAFQHKLNVFQELLQFLREQRALGDESSDPIVIFGVVDITEENSGSVVETRWCGVRAAVVYGVGGAIATMGRK